MKKFLFCAGILMLLLGVIGFLALLSSPLVAAALGLCGVLSGVLMLMVHDLLGRVEYLEKALALHKPAVENDPALPQRICSACGKPYDFDFLRCPYCDAADGDRQ